MQNTNINQKMIQQMMEAIAGYLKWQNNTVGIIFNNNCVGFINLGLNAAVKKLTKGKNSWSAEEYKSFLSNRIVSRSRSDIKNILSRLKVCDYDIIKIAEKSGAFNSKDSFWIALSESERLENKITEFFYNVCEISLNEGVKKHFGVSNGKYGIFKNRLGGSTDIESEVACYKLGTLLGINICPVWRVSKDVIFSEFRYDFNREYLQEATEVCTIKERSEELSLHATLCSKFPHFTDDIDKMFIFDSITLQCDRHVNYAIKTDDTGVSSLYPLYDNGRSLFWSEEDEIRIERCIKSIKISDVVEKIAKHKKISSLVNLDINQREVSNILSKSGFTGYKLDGCLKWINGTINILKNI
jgi:hypothetical protein